MAFNARHLSIMNSYQLSLALLIVCACTLLACEDHRASPNAGFPQRINFTAPRQYPEGIAYSAQLDRFLVTSITQGKVGTVSTSGQYEDLLTDPAFVSGNGLRVVGSKVLVCNNDQGASIKSSPATNRQLAELLIFDLNTRRLERRIDLDDLLPAAAPNFANDLTISPTGTIYVTDSFSPVIYQVSSSGQASVLVRDELRFSAPLFGLNGIAYHPNGYLIVANIGQGKLYKIDLANNNAVSEITGFGTLSGDGLALVGTTDLYVVTNNNSVTRLVSNDNFASASVAQTDAAGYTGATTCVYVNGQLYTLNARIGEVGAAMGDLSKLQAADYSIQRFR